MQPDLQKRIFANVIIDSTPEHILRPRSSGPTISSLASIALVAAAILGFGLLLFAKLQVLP